MIAIPTTGIRPDICPVTRNLFNNANQIHIKYLLQHSILRLRSLSMFIQLSFS